MLLSEVKEKNTSIATCKNCDKCLAVRDEGNAFLGTYAVVSCESYGEMCVFHGTELLCERVSKNGL